MNFLDNKTIAGLTTDPIVVLNERRRQIADRQAELGVKSRFLVSELDQLRNEARELADAAQGIDALLRINRALADRKQVEPAPAAKPKRRQAAKAATVEEASDE